MGVENTIVTVVCLNEICHCDWRMTITGCEESDLLRTTYIVNAVWSAALAIIELALLGHRLFWTNQTFFNYDRDLKSFIKIKPLEGLLLATSLTFTLRVVSIVLLILDILPNNILRSLIFDIAWQPGFIGTAIYCVGIINTLPRLSIHLDPSWFPSTKSLDFFGGILIFGLPITNITLAIITGYFEDIGDIFLAKLFMYIHFGLWFLYCTALSVGLAYFGCNLTIVINRHIAKVVESGTSLSIQLKRALNKLRIVFSSLTVCFLILGVSVLSYIFQRDLILVDLEKSISTFIPWTFAINILGTVSIVTIAAGSPIFSRVNIDGSRRGSHPDESSISKERTTFDHSGSMERGRASDHYYGRSQESSVDRERGGSLDREHEKVEKSFPNSSKRMAKVDEADIGHEWMIKFPNEGPRIGDERP